jgi:hypothetical protein
VKAGLDAETAGRVPAWGGRQVVARQVTTGSEEDDAKVARELAMTQWHGTYRRP